MEGKQVFRAYKPGTLIFQQPKWLESMYARRRVICY